MNNTPATEIALKWLYRDRDRHGNERIYFRRGGAGKIRIRELPGTPEFFARYRELCKAPVADATSAPAPKSTSLKPASDTLGWLVLRYIHEAPAHKLLEPAGQRRRVHMLESLLQEPIHPGAREKFRNFPLDRLSPKAIRVLRDRKSARPSAANARLKALRAVFKWATSDIDGEPILSSDPAERVSFIESASAGFHTWSIAEVEQFKQHHPVGSKARLAMELMLYTGFRRSDAVEVGASNVQDGWIRKAQRKGRRRRLILLEIPVLPALAAAIAAGPIGTETFLVTEYGKAFTSNGFGNWFRERCDEAGLKQCSAHGLRKAGATLAAENGATPHQLMAIFGWLTIKEAERYTRAAERRRLARDAMHLVTLDRRSPRDPNAGGNVVEFAARQDEEE